MKILNLILRFFLELCLFIALGYWGFTTSSTPLGKLVLGLGTPLLAILLWSLFVAPKAPRRLADPGRLLLESALFAGGVAALLATGQPTLALVFGGLVAVNLGLLFIFKQRGM